MLASVTDGLLRVNNKLVYLAAMFIVTGVTKRNEITGERREEGSWLLAEVMTVSISFLHILRTLVDLQGDDQLDRAAESLRTL
jgi:hypothetical protein